MSGFVRSVRAELQFLDSKCGYQVFSAKSIFTRDVFNVGVLLDLLKISCNRHQKSRPRCRALIGPLPSTALLFSLAQSPLADRNYLTVSTEVNMKIY
jgi:hypothetical protein